MGDHKHGAFRKPSSIGLGVDRETRLDLARRWSVGPRAEFLWGRTVCEVGCRLGAVAGLAAVFGAAILIVSLGAYLVGMANSRSERRRIAKSNQSQWEFWNQEALKNVEILNRAEQAALAWIIRNGQKRFRTDFLPMMDGNLITKRIVLGPLGATSDVYEVIDGVWEIRGELLKRYVGITLRPTMDTLWRRRNL